MLSKREVIETAQTITEMIKAINKAGEGKKSVIMIAHKANLLSSDVGCLRQDIGLMRLPMWSMEREGNSAKSSIYLPK